MLYSGNSVVVAAVAYFGTQYVTYHGSLLYVRSLRWFGRFCDARGVLQQENCSAS